MPASHCKLARMTKVNMSSINLNITYRQIDSKSVSKKPFKRYENQMLSAIGVRWVKEKIGPTDEEMN